MKDLLAGVCAVLRPRWVVVGCGLGLATALAAPPAHAFKTRTHAAAALTALDQIEEFFQQSTGDLTLAFDINGKQLKVPVTQAEAYDAALAFPDAFLAGAIGPDGFADLVTGQMLAHGNEAKEYKKIVEKLAGTLPPSHAIYAPFENRVGVAEYRSIDFAMDMLSFLETYPADATERQQILAFIAGYLSHGVADGFAHTWLNELTEQAWNTGEGEGILGSYTEELQHVAVESLVDSRLPASSISVPGDGGGFGRLQLAAPTAFLDAYYSSETKLGTELNFDIADKPQDYVAYFRNVDLFRGGMVYSYLNAQKELPGALRGWSKLGAVFDIAEQAQSNEGVQALLFVSEIPDRMAWGIQEWAADNLPDVPNIDPISLISGGLVSCEVGESSSVFGHPGNFTSFFREALEILGNMDARLGAHTERARVARINYNRLAECTAENLTKTNGAAFSAATPTLNTDACADIVRAGFQDEGNPEGLYRGSLRPDGKSNREFLVALRASFLGGDADDLFDGISSPWAGSSDYVRAAAYEQKNEHRSPEHNVRRLLGFLSGPAATFTKIGQALLPEYADSDSDSSVFDKVDAICRDVRSSELERCVDIIAAPIVLGAGELECQAKWAKCVAEAQLSCAAQACRDACDVAGFNCSGSCGSGGSVHAWCEDTFCLGPICAPGAYQICVGIARIADGPANDGCLQTAMDTAHCQAEQVYCSVDHIVSTVDDWIQGDSAGEFVLRPARQVCDTIDEAKRLLDCFKEDPNLSEEQAQAKQRACFVEMCDLAKQAAVEAGEPTLDGLSCGGIYDDARKSYDDLKSLATSLGSFLNRLEVSPEQVVNLLFIEEDSAKDAAYVDTMRDDLARKRVELQGTPPAPGAPASEVRHHQNTLAVYDSLITGTPPVGLSPAAIADGMDGVVSRGLAQPLGPTVRKVLGDIGPTFARSFVPFFNSVQGTKLTPLMGAADVNNLFVDNGLSPALLPQNSQGFYSAHCKDNSTTSLYCDVIASFDDPNCVGPDCPETDLAPMPSRNGWVPGRGLVAFNEYDPSSANRNVLTNFPLASTQAAYEQLYRRVFLVPSGLPGFAGFDDPDEPWTTNGPATLIPNPSDRTEGYGSTQVNGCNNVQIFSPKFRTAEFGVVGSELLLDIKLPVPTNPWWAGSLQAFVTIPSANVFNEPLAGGTPVMFTGLTPGWRTVSFTVPRRVQAAWLGDFADAQISLQLNIATCTQPILLDNLRFGGELVERSQMHIRGSERYSVRTTAVTSFDTLALWSATPALSPATQVIQGTGALALSAAGWTPVTSTWFSLSDLGPPSRSLNLDVFIPVDQPNPWWNGDVQLALDCQHAPNQYIGWRPLTYLFRGEYNSLEFTLPENVWQFVSTQSASESCRFVVNLNVNPSGKFALDNLGFIQ